MILNDGLEQEAAGRIRSTLSRLQRFKSPAKFAATPPTVPSATNTSPMIAHVLPVFTLLTRSGGRTVQVQSSCEEPHLETSGKSEPSIIRKRRLNAAI
jgi:hypothetical protein